MASGRSVSQITVNNFAFFERPIRFWMFGWRASHHIIHYTPIYLHIPTYRTQKGDMRYVPICNLNERNDETKVWIMLSVRELRSGIYFIFLLFGCTFAIFSCTIFRLMAKQIINKHFNSKLDTRTVLALLLLPLPWLLHRLLQSSIDRFLPAGWSLLFSRVIL